ncbi:multi-tm2 domain protein [Saccharibacillus alkalitolerans]|uniref:Multi-tm2 domain protein n=1 Tax=Saccharibacillus alkalitolerans TaxID=2705290 RepID=A0ABX0F8E8_9BACL|nr:multi-tm2 domain protein [Saccharibacillus alkalitolerans]NGZ74292.1 multi-tm2 domain protein [Saccharibacillus alkalitolerans]
MNQHRSKFAALLLNLIPGLGHLYWGKKIRSFMYFFLPIFMLGGGWFITAVANDEGPVILAIIAVFLIWCVSMFDLIGVLLGSPSRQEMRMRAAYYGQEPGGGHGRRYGEYPGPEHAPPTGTARHEGEREDARMNFGTDDIPDYPPYPPYPPIGEGRMMRDPVYFSDSQRFYTVILSFMPGLGHLYMGLLQRGVSFLAAFFGLATALVFLTGFTGEETFLLFFGVLPIIWIYCMFDAVQLAERKSRGERLRDFSLIERWDMARDSDGKSRTLGLLLSTVPGAGHMYLGLMKRGAQLMILFFGSIYVLDVLGLSLFLFLVPLIWCYAFFDGLQKVGAYGREPLEDKPLLENFAENRGWMGVLMVALGLYYVLKTIVMPFMDLHLPTWSWRMHEFEPYIRNAVVALLLIGGGFKLLRSGGREKA